MIVSVDDTGGNPIPWVALSGLAGDPVYADLLYAVSDSFLAEGFIYTIDVSAHPAMIVDRLQVTGASASLDLAEFRAFDDPAGLVTVGETLLRNILPELEAVSIWTAEKLEGLAVGADGQVYIVTDNDGVDEATGETLFLNLGNWLAAFGF
jgi:hypothetical protein